MPSLCHNVTRFRMNIVVPCPTTTTPIFLSLDRNLDPFHLDGYGGTIGCAPFIASVGTSVVVPTTVGERLGL